MANHDQLESVLSCFNHLMKSNLFVACDIIKKLSVAQVVAQPPNVAQFGKEVQLGDDWFYWLFNLILGFKTLHFSCSKLSKHRFSSLQLANPSSKVATQVRCASCQIIQRCTQRS
jgi:hypothetical protein